MDHFHFRLHIDLLDHEVDLEYENDFEYKRDHENENDLDHDMDKGEVFTILNIFIDYDSILE